MNCCKKLVLLAKNICANIAVQRLRAKGFLRKAHVRNFFTLVAVNILTSAFGFMTTIKIANVLNKEHFGQLAYALALGAYGVTFVRYGMDRLLTRDIVHNPEQLWKLVSVSFRLRVVLLSVVIAVVIILKPFLFGKDTDAWGGILVVLATTLVALDMQPVYDAMQKMHLHAIFYLFQRMVYFVIIWGVIVTNVEKLSIMVISIVLLLATAFYLQLQHRWLLKNQSIGQEPVRTREVFIMFKNYSGISVALLAGLSFTALTQLILKHISGPIALGGYAAAWQIVGVAMLFLNQLSRVGYPGIARITRPDAIKSQKIGFISKYLIVMMVSSLFFCFPLILFPEYILKLLFRPEYISEAATLRFMAVYTVLYSVGIVASQYLIAADLQRVYLSVVVGGGLLSILMCYLLIPTYAGLGAILALLVSHGISMMFYVCIMFWHILHIRQSY